PSGPPLNITISSRSTSSLSFTWDPPEKYKQNGVIISYTACVSHSENGPCLEIFTTSKREWLVRNLNPSTKYYVRVLSSNKAGNSAYSESKGFFTNGRAAKKATDVTSTTLTFSLKIPSKTFLYFYVVALKLKDGKEPTSSDSYENSMLVTYVEARKSTNPKPYIAAVVASSGVDGNMFILGDGRNTSDPTSRKRISTSSDYYNGALEPGTSYSIFQRIALNDKSEYYSTDWSPASKTNEYTGGPRVLTKISSGVIKAKEGDLVNLLCSAQGEPPITFSWEKDQKPLESFTETEKPHRSSFLVVTVTETSFGKYICHIRDRFQSTTHTISIQKDTAPSGPPLNIKTSSRSTSSLSFTWDPPQKDKQNGDIISYTACVSHSENGPCFKIYTTIDREWIVRNLNPSTKYYVRVLASNKAGNSAYSGSKGFFTNGRAAKKATDMTSSTLTFSLEIPSKTFLYFYVVALKLKDGKEPTSSDSYQNSELVKYAEARNSTTPKPYIAAVVASKDENMFVLGDGRNTSDPTSRRRRSTSSDYYNAPLEPGTSYSIFQRIVLNDKSEYYSTDWSSASKTNEYTGKYRKTISAVFIDELS
ncbi:Receptor-type tyrosine- phosphatase delta, partial [Paramuricea clavata]